MLYIKLCGPTTHQPGLIIFFFIPVYSLGMACDVLGGSPLSYSVVICTSVFHRSDQGLNPGLGGEIEVADFYIKVLRQ